MKLVAYLRVSTDRQAEEGLGLDVQDRAIRRWARDNGHRIATNVAVPVLYPKLRLKFGKFVTYADFPDVPYSVIASRTQRHCKISVGYNPWSGRPRTHDREIEHPDADDQRAARAAQDAAVAAAGGG